jgi:hypothetical protein
MVVRPLAPCVDPDRGTLEVNERDIDNLLDLTFRIHPANDDQGPVSGGGREADQELNPGVFRDRYFYRRRRLLGLWIRALGPGRRDRAGGDRNDAEREGWLENRHRGRPANRSSLSYWPDFEIRATTFFSDSIRNRKSLSCQPLNRSPTLQQTVVGYLDFNFDLAEGETLEPDPDRVGEIEMMLPDEVTYFGFPGSRRDKWDPIRQSRVGFHILDRARACHEETPRPIVTDALYLSCLQEKSPAGMNAVVPKLCDRLVLLPMAECIDPKIDYLPTIVEDIRRLAELSSWIHPNNDGDLDTFDGRTTFNDLTSTFYASILATAHYLLGDRLSPEVRRLIENEIRRRIFEPFEVRIKSGRDVYWWVKVTHNWNSFCLANYVCCALLLKEARHERAWYIALAEELIKYSEKGFPESGFYTEGVSYWGGGFGHYLFLSEMIRSATGGRIDWLKKPIAKKMSRFGARVEIQNNVYPAFGDSLYGHRPPPWLVHWMNNRIDPEREERYLDISIDSFEQVRNVRYLMLLFHQVDPEAAFAGAPVVAIREWFEDVQFLICRPWRRSDSSLAATFNGVHNGVNHSHNDVGAFTVVVGEVELIVDPGKETYNARTFSRKRYESGLLNS